MKKLFQEFLQWMREVPPSGYDEILPECDHTTSLCDHTTSPKENTDTTPQPSVYMLEYGDDEVHL